MPMTLNEPWRVTLLGGLSARQADRSITRFRAQKYGALLAYLAYHRKQAHPREVLVEIFWPELDEKFGRNNLSMALSSLRHQLEPPGVPAGSVLRADRFSVGVSPAAVITDVAEFEAAVQAAARAGSGAERAEHLSRALGLYAGRLLPGFYEEWIPAEEERLAGLFFDAVGQLIAHLEQAGDLPGALTHARHAVSVDPLREEGQQHLVRLLAAMGQSGAALRQYKEFERLLDEELGDEPSAALRALARRIERESGLAAPPLPVAAAVAARPSPLRSSRAIAAPAGSRDTLTFLLTDIEGSTRQWEQAGGAFGRALERHHELLRAEFARHGGQEVKEAGDSFVVAFPSAGQALSCGVAAQRALSGETWPEETGPLLVRMAIHTGDVEEKDGEYHGLALHRASRILTAAHGGQILVSEVTASLVRREMASDEVRLLDLGIYRLRDVAEPARLFQAEFSSMARAQFPPLAAEAGYPNNLPLRFTRFFGREREIAELSELLLLSEVRLVTVTGPGGTGKTRLALEVAERLSECFEGAVWFATLADISDPALIADTILEALRLVRSPQREPLDQVVEALAKQPSLLVLDNLEHLIEGGAGTVRALLSRVPSLTVLVTSRQVLGLSGEREFALSPLPTPRGAADTPERLSAFDSVRLFIDRAQEVRPDFQVTNQNAPAVAELVSRLEGIPLAIELAASRAQVLTPTQMLTQLTHRFDFLAGRKRDVAERQRTLRGAVEWSYRLLAPEVQRFFTRLSVFRGGCTIEAAEAVCEEPLALDYLAQLRECSLVLAHEAGEQIRFSMLETLREFGRERLVAAAEEMSAGKRHRDYFLALAEVADKQVTGPEEKRGLERLDADQDNLRAALGWSLTDPAGAEPGLRLAATLCRFWWRRGNMREGQQWLRSMLEREGASARTLARAAALAGLGSLLQLCAEWEAARPYLEESLSILQEFDDKSALANSLSLLGRAHEALPLAREAGDLEQTAFALYQLGDGASRRGDLEAARRYFGEHLAVRRQIGHARQIAFAVTLVTKVSEDYLNPVRRRAEYGEVVRLSREIGDPWMVAEMLPRLGHAILDMGDVGQARACFVEAATLLRQMQALNFAPPTLGGFACLARLEGQWERAARLFGAASRSRNVPDPAAQQAHQMHIATIREFLGEDAFTAAWEAGRAMAFEDALTDAFGEGSA